MAITFNNGTFQLSNKHMCYAMRLLDGNLLHLHWGAPVNAEEIGVTVKGTAFCPTTAYENGSYFLGNLMQEYPFFGVDLRRPACSVELMNGCRAVEPKYKSHRIYDGKPMPQGLPAVYTEEDSEAQTLEIVLADSYAGIEIKLFYTIFNDLPVICRRAEIKNTNAGYAYIHAAASAALDFFDSDYKYMHLHGAWAREKHVEINDVHHGIQGFESLCGHSSHIENPFMALMRPDATEDSGDVYGFSLVYSGNHRFSIISDQNKRLRVMCGINPENFKWKIDEGESFATPEAVMVYSGDGLSGMSHAYHKLYRTRLCRGKYRDAVRPALINNWEGTYFDFDEEKLLKIAESGKNIGLELFVLDDGWFGERNSDDRSLGDWYVNKKKIPSGIDGLARKINALGMKFGLWFEPEMISENSDLFRAHPQWRICVPGREPHPSRQQFILNYAREDVQDYMIETLNSILKSADISYVKWDMNRSMSDIYNIMAAPDRQGETAHRYILGLYRVLESVTQTNPEVLFESCSGGGGRNDPGMMYYMPQNWASDDTDALERIYIQYGGSMVYPASTVGSHVSAVPNHQVGRTTPLAMRGTVAMAGMFGYELDLSKQSAEDIAEMKEQVELYKRIRPLVTFGDYYRLSSPYKERYAAWMFVSEDKESAVMSIAYMLAQPSHLCDRIRLKGLDPDAVYELDGKQIHGSTLMNYGFVFECNKDYSGMMYEIKKVK